MRADKIKFRCSELGDIMSNPKTKGETLSKTAKGRVEAMFDEIEYGIVREFKNRYTEKGNRVEPQSLEMANDLLKLGLTEEQIEANSQIYRYNEWVHGTSDLETEEYIIDVKSSYDATTYPMYADEIPNKHYVDQLQGYLWLSGKQSAILAYCMIDTPEDMILDEIRREHWLQHSFWNGDEDPEIVDHVRAKHEPKYPYHLRIKKWHIERDEGRIQEFKDRIELCRGYYNELLIAHNLPDAVDKFSNLK